MKEAAYLRVNPAGAVPALDVDGWLLTQNAAILNYLADRFPDAELGGDGSPESRAEINRWLGLINADLYPVFKPLFGATGYLDDETTIEATRAQAKKQIRQRLEPVNRQLEARDWLTGARSIAPTATSRCTRASPRRRCSSSAASADPGTQHDRPGHPRQNGAPDHALARQPHTGRVAV